MRKAIKNYFVLNALKQLHCKTQKRRNPLFHCSPAMTIEST